VGYLKDNTPPGKYWVICPEIYPYRLIVRPKFAKDDALCLIVKGVLPDVEDWQFSGRRYQPLPRLMQPRNIHPATSAIDSRAMRPRRERVVFAFHDIAQRAEVATQFTILGYRFELQNEPS